MRTHHSDGSAATSRPCRSTAMALSVGVVTALTPVGRPGRVAAKVRYVGTKRQISLDPRTPLAAHATYRVTVTTSVVDRAGRAWDQSRRAGVQELSWTFRTR